MTREEVVKWLESLKREVGKAENRSLWHYAESIDMAIEALADRPTGECRTCGRNADNGGVHEDGRTKCPIQEHYALLLDGYCHLYEPYNCGAKMVREDGEKE